MDHLVRGMGLGHLGHKSSDFYAHLHVVDLYNVPMMEGECKIKWRFKGAMHLNNVEKREILDKASKGTIGYVLGSVAERASSKLSSSSLHRSRKESASASASVTATEDARHQHRRTSKHPPAPEYSHGVDDDSGDEPRAARIGPEEGLRDGGNDTTGGGGAGGGGGHRLASLGKALFHPRQALASRRRSNARDQSPNSSLQASLNGNGYAEPSTAASSPDQQPGGPPLDHSRTPRQPTQSSFAMSPLSPTGTIVAGRSQSPPLQSSPSRRSTNRKEQSQSQGNDGGTLPHAISRISTTLSHMSTRTTSDEAPKVVDPVTDSKGSTKFLPLISNACQFDQHVICAVSIPLEKTTHHLQACPIRLAVRHKVRVTPIPLRDGAACGGGDASPQQQRKGGGSIASSRNMSASSSTLSLTSQHSQKSESHAHTRIKEEYEELHLGEVNLDLSEFVEAGQSSKKSERWITRRYLLQNGKTNALLRIAVRMEWLGGEPYFVPPPLVTGQIKKDTGKTRSDSATSKSDSLSVQHTNGSGLNLLQVNSSSQSINSINQTGQRGVPSVQVTGSPNAEGRGGGAGGTNSRAGGYFKRSVIDTDSSKSLASDQAAFDLVEGIFESRIGFTPLSVPAARTRSRSTTAGSGGATPSPSSATFAAAAAHGAHEPRTHRGAKWFRELNPHHDPSSAPHRGYRHESGGSALHRFQDAARDVMHMQHPTEAQMIAERAMEKHRRLQLQDAKRSSRDRERDATPESPTKSWAPPSADRLSPQKAEKRREGLERANMASSAQSQSAAARSSAKRASSPVKETRNAKGLLRWPSPSRNNSSSSLEVPQHGSGAARFLRNGIARTSSRDGPDEGDDQRTPRLESGDEHFRTSYYHGGQQDGPVPGDPAQHRVSTYSTPERPDALKEEWSGRARTRTRSAPYPNAQSISAGNSHAGDESIASLASAATATTTASSSSGRSSPSRTKSVKWEDPPPADHEQVLAILRQVEQKQEQRRAASLRSENSFVEGYARRPNQSRGSRPPSTRSGSSSSSRRNSPDRVFGTAHGILTYGGASGASTAPAELAGKGTSTASRPSPFAARQVEEEEQDEGEGKSADDADVKRARALQERGLLPVGIVNA